MDNWAVQMVAAMEEAGRVPSPDAEPEWQTNLDDMSVRLTIRTVPLVLDRGVDSDDL